MAVLCRARKGGSTFAAALPATPAPRPFVDAGTCALTLCSPPGCGQPNEAPPDDAAARRLISDCSIVTTLTVGNRDAAAGSDLPFAYGTAAVAGAPYSAVGITESDMTFTDGNRIVRSETSHLFRDSRGRTRVERNLSLHDSAFGLPSLEMVMVNDPVGGHCYAIQKWKTIAYDIPSSNNAVIIPRPPIALPLPAAHLSTPGFDLSNTPGFDSTAAYASPEPGTQVPLGERMIDGIRTVGTRVSHLIPPRVPPQYALRKLPSPRFESSVSAPIAPKATPMQ